MNKCTIIGNLTRDPALRTTQTGIAVCNFTVAVNRRRGTEGTDYFRVTAWRALGEACARYLHKGNRAAVYGAVSARAYTGSDGNVYAALEITADDVEFLGGGRREAEGEAFLPAQDETLPDGF